MNIKEFSKLKKKTDYIALCQKSLRTTKGEQKEQILVNIHCLTNNILMFAIPNGTYKSKRASILFKAEG